VCLIEIIISTNIFKGFVILNTTNCSIGWQIEIENIFPRNRTILKSQVVIMDYN
jgi:hypothetical protein